MFERRRSIGSKQRVIARRPCTWHSLVERQGGVCSEHPGVAKVAFTGSSVTGRRVAMAAAKNLRPATMELGGKSAFIIFEDADVAKAVEWAMV